MPRSNYASQPITRISIQSYGWIAWRDRERSVAACSQAGITRSLTSCRGNFDRSSRTAETSGGLHLIFRRGCYTDLPSERLTICIIGVMVVALRPFATGNLFGDVPAVARMVADQI